MTLSRRGFVASSIVLPFIAKAALAAADDNNAVAIPIRLAGTRVVVAVTIKGAPLTFMIDTGAFASLMREDVVKTLGLAAAGQTRFNGATLPVYAAHDLVFGDTIRQNEILFAAYAGSGLGKDIAGTLAAGVITDNDSDLDFEQNRWRLYPHGRASNADLIQLDSNIVKGRAGVGSAYIFIHGTLGGKRYKFLVDTGAPGSLSLFYSAAKNSAFARPDIPFAPARTANSNGVGKVSPIVRGDVLDLGNGIRFDRPLVLLDQNPAWHLDDADGIIGLGLLRQLNLATDVRKGKLLVKRNSVPAPHESYARSGIWIDRVGSGVRISVVGVGSPAAAAGIQAGDMLPDVDFAGALHIIDQPAGTVVTFTIDRNGTRRQVSLTLADYL